MHKWIITALLVVGVWIAAKKTNVSSYAGTLWSQVRTEAKNQVPTQFEIDRARHEIAQLDKDIAGMIRPIAEYKATLSQLGRDIDEGNTKVTSRRESLLELTRQLEKNPDTIRVNGRQTPAERVKASLDRDFTSFQRLEKQLASLEKLRDAKQQSLDAAQEQLAKLIARKREFEVRVAQLEADEETLKIASLGNKLVVDDNRASTIEAALAEIERRHEVRRNELELAQSDLVSDALTPTPSRAAKTDLAAIRAHLERPAGGQ